MKTAPKIARHFTPLLPPRSLAWSMRFGRWETTMGKLNNRVDNPISRFHSGLHGGGGQGSCLGYMLQAGITPFGRKVGEPTAEYIYKEKYFAPGRL